MGTWTDISKECRRAAQQTLEAGLFRSSVNRSYYAAYAAITERLRGNVSFGQGRNNPAHDNVVLHIRDHMKGLSETTRQQPKSDFRYLLSARTDADYRPGVTVDRTMALDAHHTCNAILTTLERQDERGKGHRTR